MIARLARALGVAAALLSGASPGAPPARLTVAAAANLKPALDALLPAFHASAPGTEVSTTYGATGTLFAQLVNGAPFDLLLAADMETPRKLVEAGLAEAVTPYAVGRLVLWVPHSVQGTTVELLRLPAIAKVAIGDPRVAPYGRAAEQALKSVGLYDAVKSRLVLGASVSQAAQFAHSGNAQAAFVPLSMALVPPLSADGRAIELGPSTYEPLTQGAAIITRSPRRQLAERLLAFLTSAEGRAILERSGYRAP